MISFSKSVWNSPFVDVELNWNSAISSVDSVIFPIDLFNHRRWSFVGYIPIIRHVWTAFNTIRARPISIMQWFCIMF